MGIPAYSVRMAKESDGAISALLKLTQQPDMISFGGGLPSEESFPVEDLKNIINDITADLNGGVLQYGVTEGYLPLREEIVKLMASKGVQISVDEVLVTAGSQQGLDLIAKAFIDKGDKIIVESPTYLAALQAFRMYEAEFIEAPLDEDGVIPAELDRILATEKVKLIYLIPTFQNPSGRTISAERRKELMEVIRKYDVVLIEDDPYGDLKYTDDIYPTMKSMDTTGQVLYFGSFSKIIAPGFRVGYSIASAPILSKMVEGKQSCDLHVSIFSQMVIAEYLKRGLLPEHLQVINAQYKEKRDLMLASLEEHMPDGVTWTHPEGGLFLWLELPAGMSSNELLPEAVNQKVAYVCGDSFYAAGEPKNAMRINFSNATKENIVKGIITLAEVIKNKM
ncbi:MAG: PLP-dependent aminotransferase family protein [Peptococcaceae bacterium]|nr:PLP-dependent aminotransferase family protein [Peptococcaceae bacterium]